MRAPEPDGVDRLDRFDGVDRFRPARAVADSVLYEGYVLYPYRASATKNQLRWQFGVLTPPSFSTAEVPGSERCSMRTECVLTPGPAARLSVRVRFLQVQHRAVEDAEGRPVPTLEVGGQHYVEWDESVEGAIDLPPLPCSPPAGCRYEQVFRLPGGSSREVLYGEDGWPAGRLVRRHHAIEGRVTVQTSVPSEGGPFVKVAVTVENLTAGEPAGGGPDAHPSGPDAQPSRPDSRIGLDTSRTTRRNQQNRRDQAISRSLVAAHTMLAVDDGVFVSLIDPPAAAASAAAGCRNDGWFPVLIGAGDVVLSSPIILYDFPQVAPESPGDLYDATEIDEILALRIVTLTDREKSEARGTDPRAAAIIDRCDELSPDAWERLHGTFRPVGAVGSTGSHRPTALDSDPGRPTDLDRPINLDARPATLEVRPGPDLDRTALDAELPWWDPSQDAAVDPWTDAVAVSGIEVRKGTAVRLEPSRRCDAQDLFLKGCRATVAGVFTDVDGDTYVAVTVDDDPAAAEFDWQGRYLYFHPDEIAPLSGPEASP